MSNKPWNKLNPIDQAIRKGAPVGMEDGTKLVITRIAGFEIFNTRAYHNYETWSDGYIVEGRRDRQAFHGPVADQPQAIRVSAEDLDDAVARFYAACDDPKPWDFAREDDRMAALAATAAAKTKLPDGHDDEPGAGGSR